MLPGSVTGMTEGKSMYVNGVDSDGEAPKYKIHREAQDELIVDSFP